MSCIKLKITNSATDCKPFAIPCTTAYKCESNDMQNGFMVIKTGKRWQN